jgi:cytochrome d ubiquinol oxidase subunit I
MLPLPWLAIEFGWVLAEIGRQPWAVDGVLPTFLGASSLSVPQIWTTIIGFTALYGGLAVIEVRLMIAAIRKGPIEHHDEVAHDVGAGAGFAPLPAE